MNTLKYIVFVDKHGEEQIMLFSQGLSHLDAKNMLKRGTKIVSAGFANMSFNECEGKSVTLKKVSRPEDSTLLRSILAV